MLNAEELVLRKDLNDLIKRTFFRSPIYTRKLERVEIVDEREKPHYGNCEEDVLPNWLAENTFPYVSHNEDSRREYLFLSGGGVLCRIALHTAKLTGDEWMGTKDRTWQHVAVISSQPRNKEIPREIADTLRILDFEKINPVTDDFLKEHHLARAYSTY